MSLNDPISNTLSKIMNAERVGKKECEVKSGRLMKQILDLLKDHLYIGAYEEVEDGKGGILKLNLLGNINKCGTIKPRFSVKKTDFEKYEKRYLTAKDFGVIIVSTPQGIMTHTEAKKKGIGGKLIAYCY
ncbi:30S ribosomal protein S8 [Candidatus Woesearchaeota archaeon]|nr:30S ribosomal protein S8 [Candidatus Woesearchaeota archaeon]